MGGYGKGKGKKRGSAKDGDEWPPVSEANGKGKGQGGFAQERQGATAQEWQSQSRSPPPRRGPRQDSGDAVLRGQRTPTWSCPLCLCDSNWASRLSCYECGGHAPHDVYEKAVAAHAAVKQKERMREIDGELPKAKWPKGHGYALEDLSLIHI